jgi:preprotein translocase subunit SecA
VVIFHCAGDNENSWNIKEIYEVVATIFPIDAKDKIELQEIRKTAGNRAADAHARTKIINYLISLAHKAYDNVQTRINSPEVLKMIEKSVLLHAIDYFWIFHLEAINHLRTGIGLRGYAQQDPLVEYKKEAYHLFNELLNNIQKQVVYSIFKVGVVQDMAPGLIEQAKEFSGAAKEMNKGSVYGDEGNRTQQVVKKRSEVGRNEPCPCGSGKKYKKCCGA